MNTNELILSEIITIKTEIGNIKGEIQSINTEIKGINTEIQVLHKADNDLKDMLKESETRLSHQMEDGFNSLREAINFIGNKVFDNHERRIASLENKTV